MGYDAPILREDKVFKGKRKNIRFAVFADAACTVARDVAPFALAWALALDKGLAGPPLILKSNGGAGGLTVSGVFNADPALNTQRVTVALNAADFAAIAAGDYYHELVRTDAGFEDVLADGRFSLLSAISLA